MGTPGPETQGGALNTRKYDPREIKKANIIVFDKQARNYTKSRRQKFNTESAQCIIEKYQKVIGKNFAPVDRLLDIGCGWGNILLNLSLAGKVRCPHGIDISQGMLDECYKNARKLGIDVTLMRGDAERLPYQDNCFDMVIGHGFLHHVPDYIAVFKEVYRVLKPGKTCIFTEPSKTGSRIIAMVRWIIWLIPLSIRRLSKSKIEKMVEIHTFSPEELEEVVSKVGFSQVHTEPFAGFISRIIYWMFDPIVRRFHNKYLHRMVNGLVNVLFVIDERVFRLFIPKGWFDEVAIFARK